MERLRNLDTQDSSVWVMWVIEKYHAQIKEDIKTIEVRAGVPSMREIKVGDLLRFNNDSDCERFVIRIGEYQTLQELAANEDLSQVDPTLGANQLLRLGRRIFPVNKGFLAFELARTMPELEDTKNPA